MKTQMLELTIFKISTLLQRGFGELGARIVAKTLTNNEVQIINYYLYIGLHGFNGTWT